MYREKKRKIAFEAKKQILQVVEEFNKKPYELNICWDECIWVDDEFFNFGDLEEMKNPYETDDIKELREIAFYWMQQHEKLRLENKVYIKLLQKNKIECSLKNLIDKINNQIQEENG